MSRRPSSRQWLDRQNRDSYTKQARKSHYRSRAVYKLQQMDEKYQLFRSGHQVIDLGAAPGSWSQYALERVGTSGKVIAVDILSMEPLAGVEVIEGDFTEDEVYERCLKASEGAKIDLVISDMAPNLSGIRDADQARSMYLVELVLEFATQVLDQDGILLVKCFQGAGIEQYQGQLRERFDKVMVQKPKASRAKSREFYMLAMGFQL